MLVKLVNEALARDLPGIEWREKPDTPGHYDLVFGKEEEILSLEMTRSVMGAFSKSPRKDHSILPASSAGKCLRQRWLHLISPEGEEPTDVRSRLNFAAGGAWEAIHRAALRNASKHYGSKLGIRFVESPGRKEISVGTEKMGGYYDGIVEARPEVLQREIGGSPEFWKNKASEIGKDWLKIMFEMKTQSDYGFKSFKRSGLDDAFGYRTQMGLYLRQAIKDGDIDIPVGVWYVVNKNTGHCAEQFISLKNLAEEVALADKSHATLSAALEKGLPPKRGYELKGDGTLGFQCGYCPSKWQCYSDEKIVGWTRIEDERLEEARWQPKYEREPRERLRLSVSKGRPVFTPSSV